MSSDKKYSAPNLGPSYSAENFRPFDRDLGNVGPIPSKGKVDPTKKPPFKIGKPVGEKPAPPKDPGKRKK